MGLIVVLDKCFLILELLKAFVDRACLDTPLCVRRPHIVPLLSLLESLHCSLLLTLLANAIHDNETFPLQKCVL